MVYEPLYHALQIWQVYASAQQLKFWNFFSRRETMAAEENRFAAELTEDEVIKLLENATPGNTKKATKYGVKIFQGIYLHISIFTKLFSP